MLITTDPLSLVFIGCFLFGMLFLLVTGVLGNLGHTDTSTHTIAHHSPVHIGGHSISHAASSPPNHLPVHVPAHLAATAHTSNATIASDIQSLFSHINLTSIVLFLTGFGLFGYILHNTLQLLALLTLALAGVSGVVITVLLLLLLNRLFGNSEGATIQDVSDRTGMLGKVSTTIQANSLGEVIYISPGGMRKSVPARSVDGRRLERDQEVVVINDQHGIAEVDTWEHFIEEQQPHLAVSAPQANELAKLRVLLDEPAKPDTELVIREDLQKE